MVVISSGVLITSQQEKFLTIAQYNILSLHTLEFKVGS